MTHDTPQLLDKAAQLGQAGRLQEAAALCEEVLKGAPDNVEALHLLGLAALQSGRPQDALERFQAAVKIDERFAPAHNHAGQLPPGRRLRGQGSERPSQSGRGPAAPPRAS
jgi:cytochrome c-type biogenesis protein CcmH/NrfG